MASNSGMTNMTYPNGRVLSYDSGIDATISPGRRKGDIQDEEKVTSRIARIEGTPKGDIQDRQDRGPAK